MKENRRTNDRMRKASPTDVSCELVFMAPPTLAGDGPRADSIEFVPVLFVAITRINVASLDQETRVGEQNGWIGHYHYFNINAARARQLNKERSALGHHGGRSWAPGRGARQLGPAVAVSRHRAPVELADSGGALPRARQLNTERRATTAARPWRKSGDGGSAPAESGSSIVCPGAPSSVRELHRLSGSSAVHRGQLVLPPPPPHYNSAKQAHQSILFTKTDSQGIYCY